MNIAKRTPSKDALVIIPGDPISQKALNNHLEVWALIFTRKPKAGDFPLHPPLEGKYREKYRKNCLKAHRKMRSRISSKRSRELWRIVYRDLSAEDTTQPAYLRPVVLNGRPVKDLDRLN